MGSGRWRLWPRELLLMVGVWLATRLVMLALVRAGFHADDNEIITLYHDWSHQLRGGSFPIADPSWQYPPAAGLVMLAPGFVPGLSYLRAFVLLTLIADAAVTAALARVALRPGRSFAGAYLWVISLPLMLGLPYMRFDVIVTATAVLGLLTLARRPWLGGGLAGLGALMKAWPVLTVLGTPRRRATRQAWTTLLVAIGLVSVGLTLGFRGAFDFLHGQKGRGIEIESLGGTALQVAHLFGWSGSVQDHYGSMEFFGPHVRTVTTASLLLTGLAFAWLVLWRIRARQWTQATPFDAALCGILLFIVTSRVISPQYMVWLTGLSAVCLTVERTTQRTVAVLVVVATSVTAVEYPFNFDDVIASSPKGVTIMIVRNGLLAAAALFSCIRLWRGSTADRGTR